jgi:hypothetical protein
VACVHRKSSYPDFLEHLGHSEWLLPPKVWRKVHHPIPGVSSVQMVSALVNSSDVRPAFLKIPATCTSGAFVSAVTNTNIRGLRGSKVELKKQSPRVKGRVHVRSQKSVTYECALAIDTLRARHGLLEICAPLAFLAVNELRFLERFVEGRCVMVSATGSDVG